MGKDNGRLSAESQRREEEHGQLMAVAHSLTAVEQVVFLGNVARSYPRLQGAGVADVLELTADRDMFLDQTEPFFTRFDAQMPEDVHYAPLFAAHLILLMGWALTPGRVWSLLQRAGVVDPPRFPEVEVGLLMAPPGPGVSDGNHLLLMARTEQGMRAAGVPESEITEFRQAVRRLDTPGFSRNVADIASWVTIVDRYTEIPRKVYDPTDDIAVLLYAAHSDHGTGGQDVKAALANLRSHLDMRAPETVKSSLLTAYGRTPE